MFKDQLTLLFCLQINDIPVDGFHHIVRGPTASLHNVLIRNSDRMHDGRGVMPQVMKAEVREVRLLQQIFHPVIGSAGAGGLLWSQRIREDPLS